MTSRVILPAGGCAHLGETLEIAAPTLPDGPRLRRARRAGRGRKSVARTPGTAGARLPGTRARAAGADRRGGGRGVGRGSSARVGDGAERDREQAARGAR